MTTPTVRVLIASPLEPHLIDRVRAVDPRLDVAYRADLLGQPRYPGDHAAPATRTPPQEAEWTRLLREAEIMFDVSRPGGEDLPRQAPRLRWIQLSSSGVGTFVERTGLGGSSVVVTNAAGVHATPLAEFVLFAMLYFAKRMPRATSAATAGSALPSTRSRARRWASWGSAGWGRRSRERRARTGCASSRPGARGLTGAPLGTSIRCSRRPVSTAFWGQATTSP
jgi:hypothetical protein